MRKITVLLFTLLGTLGFFQQAHAQAPCTELFISEYVEGSSNNKALEIYNPNAGMVDLTPYQLHRYNNGGTTSPDILDLQGMLAGYDVFVAVNPSSSGVDAALLAVADTLDDITFYNGNDAILFINTATGDTIDVIGEFGVSMFWTVGSGATNENTLVRMSSIQGGNNDWTTNANEWDVFPQNDFSYIGSHSSSCEPTSSTPEISFAMTAMSVSEGVGTVTVDVNIVSAAPDTADVDVSLDLSSTATSGMDFTWTDTTITFPASATSPISLTLTIIDDTDGEATETIVLNLSNATNGAGLGDSVLTISILDNEYPSYPIDLITNDAVGDGEPDSLNVVCQIQGIVHGIDLQGGSSVQFTIIDSTGGIGLFSSNTFGYTVNEGDEVIVQGDVGQFNGLAQMGPDTIIVVSTGNATATPVVVTALDESTESELITLECVTIIDPTDWPTSAGGSVNVDVTNGVDTFTVRIDNDVDLNGTPVPASKWLTITGIGGQFDGSYPRNDGYQLLPRYMADVVENTDPNASFGSAATAVAEDDMTYGFMVMLENSNPDTTMVTVSLDATGTTATMGTDFMWADTTLEFTGCGTLQQMVEVMVMDDSDIESDETVSLVISSVSNNGTSSTDTLTITITDNDLPTYPIDLITNDADGDGEADSLGVVCQIQGIVHGIDLQGGSSVQFTIIDSTGGVGLFSSNTFGYTVNEGDEVIVQGDVGQFNGLAQMGPDTIILVSTGNPTVTPAVVTMLDESTESELVTLDCVSIIDTTDWPTSGGSVNVDVTNGVDTFTIRIDSDVDLNGTPVPASKWLTITGIGGQFDGSYPRNDGYQLLPRYMADVVENPDPNASFGSAATTVAEDDMTYGFMVMLENSNPDTTMVTVSLDASGTTAMMGTDFMWADTTLEFSGCGTFQQMVEVMVMDDSDVEGDETVSLVISSVSNNGTSSTDTLMITIEDNDVPAYPIGLISEDAVGDGLADSLNVVCQVQGIVHGIDLQGGSNIQFTMIDSTGGIGVFSNNDYGYVVNEGDEVVVVGEVTHFNGLSQMTPDTIYVVSAPNPIVEPVTVTMLDETTESEIVRLECVMILDTADWPTSGGSVNIDVSNGVDTFAVRIDSDTDLNGTPAPSQKWLTISGIGGQFDGSFPHNDGYQLLPRYMADVVENPDPSVGFEMTSVSVAEIDTTLALAVMIENSNPDSTAVEVTLNATGTTATSGSDFNWSDTTLYFTDCGDGMQMVNLDILADGDTEGDEDIVLTITSVSNNGMVTTESITITIGDVVSINDLLDQRSIRMYPNPTSGILNLRSDYRMDQVRITNMLGQDVMVQTPANSDAQLQVSALPKGVYLIRVETAEGSWNSRFVKE